MSYYIVKYTLKADTLRALEWFNLNSLVANPEKFQMLVLGTSNTANDHLEFATFKVAPSSTVKLLGVNIDKNLNFNFHIEKICKLLNNKTNALIRIRKFLDDEQARKIAQAYILSQLNYCN